MTNTIVIEVLLAAVVFTGVAVVVWLRRYSFWKRRSRSIQWRDAWASILFVLIFSGPPTLRVRDPAASIRGDLDYVVILHLLVWGLAGVWVCYEVVLRRLAERRRVLQLWAPQKIGLVLVMCLGASALVSPGFALTLFKVYQILVMLLFSLLFVQKYGADACLNRLLVGSALLVIILALSAIIAPDVLFDGYRLRGDLIAPAGDTSVFLLVLLCANRQKLTTMRFFILFILSLIILVLSRTRTAYICMGTVLLLAIVLRPNLPTLRRFAFVVLALLPSAIFSPSISDWIVREPQSVSTLSDRTGLWATLTDITLKKSPVIGLGYYAASRVYGPQYNAGLGTAHSEFIETFVGGGILSITVLIVLWLVLGVYAASLLRKRNDRILFVSFSLLVSVLLASFTGTVGGPDAFVFWCVAAMLPSLRVTRGHQSDQLQPGDGKKHFGFVTMNTKFAE